MLDADRHRWEARLGEKAATYLRDAFGAALNLHRTSPSLPFFINDQYVLWSADLLGRPCLLMAPTPDSQASPEEMGRHVELVRGKTDERLVLLLLETLTPARRHALVTRRIAFLVPGVQIFVPEALLDLRERAPRPSRREVETFSPTAQLAILGALLRPGQTEASATELARVYGVAVMSMTRAFDELEAAGLADAGRQGQIRALRFHETGRALWDAAAPRLQSPVRKVRAVVIPYPDQFPARLAGESALARYTSLASPRRQRLAVAASEWNQRVRDHSLRETEAGAPESDDIETWSYDPAALGDHSLVDRLSLYLSLRDHLDERVAIAAEELLETVPWS